MGKKKPKLKYLIICDYFEEGESKKLNVKGIFNMFTPKNYPFVLNNMFVVEAFVDGNGEYLHSIYFEDPDGKIIEKHERKFSLSKSNDEHKIVSQFANLIIETPGKYFIKIFLDNKFYQEFFIRSRDAPIKAKLSKNEIKKIIKNPKAIKTVRAAIGCVKCAASYTFQFSITKKKIPKGMYRIPANDKFTCKSCKNEFDTRPIRIFLQSQIGEEIQDMTGREGD